MSLAIFSQSSNCKPPCQVYIWEVNAHHETKWHHQQQNSFQCFHSKEILSTHELMSKDHAEFVVFLVTMKILLTKSPGSRSHCAIAFMSKGSEIWFSMVTLLSWVKGSWREGWNEWSISEEITAGQPGIFSKIFLIEWRESCKWNHRSEVFFWILLQIYWYLLARGLRPT